MRDRVIHGYFEVDLKVVWEVVTVDIPHDLAAVQRAFEVLEAEEDDG